MSDGGVDILGHDVTAIQQAARHVLAVTRVAFHHLCGEVREGGEKRNGVRWGDGAGKRGRSGGGEMACGWELIGCSGQVNATRSDDLYGQNELG